VDANTGRTRVGLFCVGIKETVGAIARGNGVPCGREAVIRLFSITLLASTAMAAQAVEVSGSVGTISFSRFTHASGFYSGLCRNTAPEERSYCS
jgi:hypothetical protein